MRCLPRQHVEKDAFDADTPLGPKPMTNLVFTHDPSAPRRFVLSAHLDSKYFPTHPADQFVGATDSAAPCAMLLDLATALTPWLDARKRRVEEAGGEEGRTGQGETLQIIFFDGEEAFQDWTATDSIYGARHLVEKWSETETSPAPIQSTPKTALRRISHLVLLDLLGAPNPLIRSFFPNTGWLFDEFMHSEDRLGRAGILWPGLDQDRYSAQREQYGARERSFFVPRNAAGMQMQAGSIEDDHLPFMRAGVPIVHMIAVPFPSVWHTIKVPRPFVERQFHADPADATRARPRPQPGRCSGTRPPDNQSLGSHPPPYCRRVSWLGPERELGKRERPTSPRSS